MLQVWISGAFGFTVKALSRLEAKRLLLPTAAHPKTFNIVETNLNVVLAGLIGGVLALCAAWLLYLIKTRKKGIKKLILAVRVCACVHVCVRACARACACVWNRTCSCVCMRVHECAHAQIAHANLPMPECPCVHVHAYVYTNSFSRTRQKLPLDWSSKVGAGMCMHACMYVIVCIVVFLQGFLHRVDSTQGK